MASATLSDESLELVLSFEDARRGVKSKFSTFRMLLGRREMELLAKIDELESRNRSILEQKYTGTEVYWNRSILELESRNRSILEQKYTGVRTEVYWNRSILEQKYTGVRI